MSRPTAVDYLGRKLPVADSAVIEELDRVEAVVAAYSKKDEDGVLHVFSVVANHEGAVYEQVMDAEDRIRFRLPGVAMHFHLRAHQGRGPQAAVPFSCEPLFVR